jgi:hypothetical protein
VRLTELICDVTDHCLVPACSTCAEAGGRHELLQLWDKMWTSELSSLNNIDIQDCMVTARNRLKRFQITNLPLLEKWVDNLIATSKW